MQSSSPEARQAQFETAARRVFALGRTAKVSRAFGVSNSAKVIEGGIQLGVLNLDTFGEDLEQFVIETVIRFFPSDEVFFALAVQEDLDALHDRLTYMKGRGVPPTTGGPHVHERSTATLLPLDPAGLTYSHRNNLVTTCLARDGHLYLRNKGFWASLDFDLALAGPGVPINRLLLASFTGHPSKNLGPAAEHFIAELSVLAHISDVQVLPTVPHC